MVEPNSSAADGGAGETRLDGAIRSLDRATNFVERPLRRATRSSGLNPLPHAGTISVFLLGVVILSGLYVTLFFSFGHAASYDAVASMEDHAIQRVVRAMHRYSSAALVVTTLVHGWRIFAAQRFSSRRRRWRWASGVSALLLVWLAGVSGYWLVWDRRAAALSEITARLLKPFGWANGFVVDNLLGNSPGTGSGFLLFLWFVHLALTAAIGWFTYRHLRRSKQLWLPPREWMGFMGGALVLVSLLLPLGMLGPARPDQLVADMPLDPFVLFLVPPLLSPARWLAVPALLILTGISLLLPRLLRRSDPSPVSIDEAACTGCEICVQDCPYDALSMRLTPGDGSIAIVDADMCVSCGICVGSCAFDAIELPGWSSPASDVQGRDVVVVCDRHDMAESGTTEGVLVQVPCAGMFVPGAVRGYVDRGAESVQLIGCDPSDCRYGIGNTLAAERLSGERAPFVPHRYASTASATWKTADVGGDVSNSADLGHGLVRDENSSAASGQLLAPAAIVLLSVLVVVAATRAPFRTDSSQSDLRVIVDHVDEAQLQETGSDLGDVDSVVVAVDGITLETRDLFDRGRRSIGFEDWELHAGSRDVKVTLLAGDGTRSVLFDDTVQVEAGERLVVTATDVPPDPGSADGRNVFNSRAAGCGVCHSTRMGRDGVGPSLFGVADVAASRVEGLSAEQYFRQSILLPDQHIVDGWPSGQMLPIYRDRLTERELESLLVFLTTLTAEGSS